MKNVHTFGSFNEVKDLEGLVFIHQSHKDLSVLSPQSYEDIEAIRGHEYIDGRRETELEYHQMLGDDGGTSFLYATIEGFNKMEMDPELNAYYFHLDKDQIEKTIFEVVDRELGLGPLLGMEGLVECQKFWDAHKEEFGSYEDPVVGRIDPRIEVVINYQVVPFKVMHKMQ